MEWTNKKGKQMVVMTKTAKGVWNAQKVLYNLNGKS